jgi:hypothetical protein
MMAAGVNDRLSFREFMLWQATDSLILIITEHFGSIEPVSKANGAGKYGKKFTRCKLTKPLLKRGSSIQPSDTSLLNP